MSARKRHSARCQVLIACSALAFHAPTTVAQVPSSADGQIVYHVRGGDTLIGLARRLLSQRSLWKELGSLNHIAQERHLIPGSELKIPIPWLRWSDGPVTVLAVGGAVSVDGRLIVVGDTLRQGDSISTGDGGSLAVRLPDGSEVHLPPRTTVVLESVRGAQGTDAPDIQLRLPDGHVEVAAQKHRDIGRFEIRTPTAVTAVRGTHYRAHYSETDSSATSETLEGVIEVRASNAALPVRAGFGTLAKGDRPPIPPVPLLPAPSLDRIGSDNQSSILQLDFEPVPGAVRYRVQISRTEDFAALEVDQTAASLPVAIPGLQDGGHWLRVRAADANGIEGRDAQRQFTQHTLPDAARLQPTVEGADGGPAHLRFFWQGNAAGYHFELAEQGKLDKPLIVRDVTPATAELERLPAGRYEWRVAALNAKGERGPWSELGEFTQRPSPPQVLSVVSRRKRPVELHFTLQPGYAALVEWSPDADFHRIAGTVQSSDGSAQIAHLHPGEYFARVRFVSADGYSGPVGESREFRVPVPIWVWFAIGGAAAAAAAL